MSVLAAAQAQLPLVKGEDGEIMTQQFLSVCKLVFPVIDKLGTAFGIVKMDIGGNIDRLHARFLTDPARFARLFAIVEDEVARGEHEGPKSCAKGLLWLKRAMQFIVGLVRGVGAGKDTSAAVQDAYSSALKPYHGMFSYGAFQTAFRFLPTSGALLAAVCGAGADEGAARADFAAFAGAFAPLLGEVDAWMESKGLNDPARV